MIGALPAIRLMIAAALLSPAGDAASAAPQGEITVRDAWVRESTATRTSSSAYFTIENRTNKAVTLVKVSLDDVADAQVHSMADQQGRAVMRPVSALPVPARGSVDLAPGGTHVMLMDIARPLKAGTTVEMTLTFDDGRTRTVRAVVRPLSAMSAR